MKRLHEFLLYLMVILTPFQDTFLREPLRQLGASFAVLPLLALVAIDCVNWLASEERRVNLKWVAIGLYALLLNALALTLSGTEWNGVNLLLKVPNVFFLTALALYVVFRPKWIELDHLGAAVKIAFGIAVVGVLLGDLNLLGLRGVVDNPILHRTINPDTRWRGLTSEASTLSLSLGSLGLLSAALSRGIARALFLTATVFLLCAGASKGAIPAMLAVGIGLIVFSTGNRFWAAAITILLLPVGYFGYQRVQILSATDALSQTTTAATRELRGSPGIRDLGRQCQLQNLVIQLWRLLWHPLSDRVCGFHRPLDASLCSRPSASIIGDAFVCDGRHQYLQ